MGDSEEVADSEVVEEDRVLADSEVVEDRVLADVTADMVGDMEKDTLCSKGCY